MITNHDDFQELAVMMDPAVQRTLQSGLVIPAHPLALDANRKLDERHQRALTRYYLASGAGGLAVGVHTTQFAIRDPGVGLYRPVLELAAEETSRCQRPQGGPVVRIAGICGQAEQALGEAALARELGYHAGLVSLAGMQQQDDRQLIEHCRRLAGVIPVFGFYLQPAVGGRVLSYRFWRQFCEIENAVAIKIAPFNRYQTLEVIRAVAASQRDDIALYTGNDDNIVLDLLTPYRVRCDGRIVQRRMVGGLLGHWAVWTSKAVDGLRDIQHTVARAQPIPQRLLRHAIEVTDANAALFDAANGFRGCIAGVNEVLRRQGLLQGNWCLDPDETLSPGQAAEIDRVSRAYPHLSDDGFVAEHLGQWLSG